MRTSWYASMLAMEAAGMEADSLPERDIWQGLGLVNIDHQQRSFWSACFTSTDYLPTFPLTPTW